MCKPASLIVTRRWVYYSITCDSHEAIIEEQGLHADGVGGPNIVRTEISPPDGDYSLPLDQWIYHVDQDVLPDWYDADDSEQRCRVVLQDWARHHIVRNGVVEGVRNNTTRILLGSSQVRAQAGGECWLYDDSKSVGQAGGRCHLHGDSQSRGQTSGNSWHYDHAHSYGQAGGVSRFHGDSRSYSQAGGWCYLYDDSQSHGRTGGDCYDHRQKDSDRV